jgi:hypothetical protein
MGRRCRREKRWSAMGRAGLVPLTGAPHGSCGKAEPPRRKAGLTFLELLPDALRQLKIDFEG